MFRSRMPVCRMDAHKIEHEAEPGPAGLGKGDNRYVARGARDAHQLLARRLVKLRQGIHGTAHDGDTAAVNRDAACRSCG